METLLIDILHYFKISLNYENKEKMAPWLASVYNSDTESIWFAHEL